ncbi:hypothetical protein ACF5DM_001408 [Salmonella enterica]|uniref:hypothetical protein n=2 Tax=Enterobacteriaceae TaxID=543 RepID=UPI0022939926|nr:hypothetical protein [Klebsiella pneumoniae]HEE5008229.1 hypothetical protein [Klebsiella pneumoniae]
MCHLRSISEHNEENIHLILDKRESNTTIDFFFEIYDRDYYQIDIPLDFDEHSIAEYDRDNYDIFFLLKKDVKENDVVKLISSDTNKSIGYLLPVISLESNDHDYAADKYFLRYAYIGIQEALCRCKENSLETKLDLNKYTFKLTDIFDDELVICIIYKPHFNITDFSKISPILFKHGYIRFDSKTSKQIIYKPSTDDEFNNKITLCQINNSIIEAPLIDKILHEQFPIERNIAFKFFILYQIIELLIERVYQHQQNIIISNLVANVGNLSKSKDIIGSFQEISSEKRRLKLLFSKYINNFENKTTLTTSCYALVRDAIDQSIDEGKDMVEYFYPIRNFIVHNYRNFPENKLRILDDIINEFINALPSILKNYDETS